MMFGNKGLRKKIKELEAEIGRQKYLIQQLGTALREAKRPCEEKHTFCRTCKHNYGEHGNYMCDKVPCQAFEPKETYQ